MTTTWDPCETIESLADVLTEWTRSRDCLTSAELAAIYRQHGVEKLRRWLECNARQDDLGGFDRSLGDPRDDLTRWEQLCQAGTASADDCGDDVPDSLSSAASWLRDLAARIGSGAALRVVAPGVPPATASTQPPLNATDRAAMQFIKEAGPVTALEVANAISKVEQHFRNKIVRKLRPYGLQNDHNQAGYYFPTDP